MRKVFLIDVSGSMPLGSSDRLAWELMHELHVGDEFEVIYFDHQPYQVFDGLVSFSEQNVSIALLHQNQIAGGGTCLGDSLKIARKLIEGDEMGKVIILSDGYWAL